MNVRPLLLTGALLGVGGTALAGRRGLQSALPTSTFLVIDLTEDSEVLSANIDRLQQSLSQPTVKAVQPDGIEMIAQNLHWANDRADPQVLLLAATASLDTGALTVGQIALPYDTVHGALAGSIDPDRLLVVSLDGSPAAQQAAERRLRTLEVAGQPLVIARSSATCPTALADALERIGGQTLNNPSLEQALEAALARCGAPAPPGEGVEVCLYVNGNPSPINTVLHTGDQVNLRILPPQDGYLQIWTTNGPEAMRILPDQGDPIPVRQGESVRTKAFMVTDPPGNEDLCLSITAENGAALPCKPFRPQQSPALASRRGAPSSAPIMVSNDHCTDLAPDPTSDSLRVNFTLRHD